MTPQLTRIASGVAVVTALGTACDAAQLAETKTLELIDETERLALALPMPYILYVDGPTLISCDGLPPCSTSDDNECCNTSTHEESKPSLLTPEESVDEWSGGPHGFRTPSLLHVPGGPLIAIYQERDNNRFCDGERVGDSGYIRLVMRMKESPSTPWGPKSIVCDVPGDTCGSQGAVYDATEDRVVVLASHNDGTKVQGEKPGCPSIQEGDRHLLLITSSQVAARSSGRLQFSTPEDVSAWTQPPNTAWDCVGPGNGIDLGNGRLVFPACLGRNVYYDPAEPQPWSYEKIAGARTSEGTVVETNDGLLLRNDRAAGSWIEQNRDFRRRAARQNLDGSWSPWFHDGQPLSPSHRNPNCGHYAESCTAGTALGCQASMRRFSSGGEIDRLIYSGPASSQDRWGLTVRISYDEGDSWLGREILEIDESYFTGYSSAVRVGNEIGVLFERRRGTGNDAEESVHYLQLSLSALLCGRREPILIGANAWLGRYERELVRSSGEREFSGAGRLDGQPVEVQVKTTIDSLVHDDSVELQARISPASLWEPAHIDRYRPSRLSFGDGREVEIGGEPGSAWCKVGY